MRQAETGRRMQNLSRPTDVTIYTGELLHPRPAHQNSMPDKTNRDIMMQQYRAYRNTQHRIAYG